MRICYIVILISILAAGCSPVINTQKPLLTTKPNITLIPFATNTVTATLLASNSDPTPTQLPPPTATPFTHVVKKDETMLGIAFKYGIKLEDLQAANPGINPRLLSIDTLLIIPLNGQLATPQPTEKALQFNVSEVVCYPQRDGTSACFSEIRNLEDLAYDNLVLQFEVYSRNGDLLLTQNAVLPVDRLGAGQALPVFTNLPVPFPDDLSVNLRVVSALVVPSDGNRYVEVPLDNVEFQQTTDRLSFKIMGNAGLPNGLSSLWLLGVAYNLDDRPIGIRRMILQSPCQATTTPDPGNETATPVPECFAEVPFTFDVYSSGPEIERVKIFTEGHR